MRVSKAEKCMFNGGPQDCGDTDPNGGCIKLSLLSIKPNCEILAGKSNKHKLTKILKKQVI